MKYYNGNMIKTRSGAHGRKVVYRITVKKAGKGDQREFLWETFASRKKAQELCDKINALDASRDAVVVVK